MEVIKTAIDGVFILEPRIFNDIRQDIAVTLLRTVPLLHT